MLLGRLVLLVSTSLVTSFDQDELVKTLAAVLDGTELKEPFDVDKENVYDRLQQVFNDHGIGMPDSFVDEDVLRGIWNLVTTGSKMKTFASANFVNQMACYQGRSYPFLWNAYWVNTRYNNYGCYCGAGFQTGPTVDETDRCCRVHDHCYARVMAKYGIRLGCQTYTTQYTQTCCKHKKITKCNDPGPSAGRELCECDQVMSSCVSQPSALKTYSKSNRNIRKTARCSQRGNDLSLLDILKSCKHAGKPIKTFKTQYQGQGKCPKKK